MSGRCRRKRKLERKNREDKYQWSQWHTFVACGSYCDVMVKKPKTVRMTNEDLLAVAVALTNLFETKRYPRTKDVKAFLMQKGNDVLAQSILKIRYL